MRKTAFCICASLIALLLGSCKSPSGPSSETLAGTWRATKAQYVKVADANVTVDVVAEGSSVSLVLATGTYTFTVNDTRVPQSVTTGSWTSSKDTLTLAPAGTTFTIVFDMSLNGSTLTLNGGGVMFDFNFNETFEDATLNMGLAKQ
jgi:hypothetical protein